MSQPPRDEPDDVQDVVPGAPLPAYDRGDGRGGVATAGTGATMAFVLGILSVVGMPFFGPVAWILGRRAVQAADAADAAHETAGNNRGVALAGMVLGIIGTVMLVVVVFALVAFVVFIVASTRTP